MIATVTLPTTTFATTVSAQDTVVYPVDLSNMTSGICLYLERELMKVVDGARPGGGVAVLRGQEGTFTRAHSTASTVYIGRGDQFYVHDPMGTPPQPIPVYPHINVLNGNLWTVQGDDGGASASARSWQPLESYQENGPLGIRTNKVGVGLAPADPFGGTT